MADIKPEYIAALVAADVRVYVVIDGLHRIDRRVLEKGVSSITSCETLHRAYEEAERAVVAWKEAGLFRNAAYNFEPSADGGPRDVIVRFNVEEARSQKSGGIFATDAAVPEVRLALKNVAGGKYSVQMNYVPPTSRLHSWSFGLTSLVPWFGQRTEYTVGATTEKKLLHPADVERIEEVKAVTHVDPSSVLTLGFQRRHMAARDECRIPQSLLRDFPTHGKGFLRYDVTVNRTVTHSHPLLFQLYPLPIGGYEAFLSSEVCGGLLGGSSCFHKWECQLMRYVSLGRYVSLQSGVRVGSVAPFTAAHIPLNDRLFLSHRHVRGFKSIGPNTFDAPTPAAASSDANNNNRMTRYAPTGGTAVLAATTSLNFPFLPYPNNGLVAMHLFADGGALRWVRQLSDFVDWRAWLAAAKMSVGGGIVVTRLPFVGSIPNGRFELNVSYPLRIQLSPFRVDLTPLRTDERLFDRVRFGLTWSSSVSL